MPIYLVRWPGTRASLIKAKDETQLLDIIDEVASPGECSWSVYRGPLWVDFSLPVEARLEAQDDGPLRPDEVVLEELDADDCAEGRLVAEVPDTDSGSEMAAAILKGAFPYLAGVIHTAAESDEPPGDELVRAAVVADVVAHENATRNQGTTLGEDLTPRPTQTWFFRRLDDGTFADMPATLVEDFTMGSALLPPGAEGFVRFAVVEVTLRNKKPAEAVLGAWWRFPVSKDGLIADEYKAAMFTAIDEVGKKSPEGIVDAGGRFLQRRMRALSWKPSAEDVAAAARAVNKKAGRKIIDDPREPEET